MGTNGDSFDVGRDTQPCECDCRSSRERLGWQLIQIFGPSLQSLPLTTGLSAGEIRRIGRCCDVQVPDATISKTHAEIVRDIGRVTVSDLGSHNGVFVNGRRVRNTSLRHADVLRLGSSLS